jgi:CPA1 family monovalent cation:H+ antiporter
MTFGVVAFTIVFQGLSIKPLLRALGLVRQSEEQYQRTRVEQIAISSAQEELNRLYQSNSISEPVYDQLRRELENRSEQARNEISAFFRQDQRRMADEVRVAKVHLITAERSAIEQALYDGLISAPTAGKMLNDADHQIEEASKVPEGESEEH